MKRIVILVVMMMLCALVPFPTQAQSWLERLGRRVAESAKEKVADKVEETVDDAIDETWESAENAARDGVKKSTKKSKKAKKQTAADEEDEQEIEAATPVTTKPNSLEINYAKSDFVPGDEIIFEDDLANEQLGEFPSKWDLMAGVVEIAKLNGENTINFVEDASRINPLMEEPKNYLPEIFTVEFDFWIPGMGADVSYDIRFSDQQRNNLWEITLSRGGWKSNDNEQFNLIEMEWGYYNPSDEWISGENENISVSGNSWNHFALSFNKRALKIYINGIRIANIPNAKKPQWWSIFNYTWGGFNGKGNMHIKNIRIAKGAVPLYDRMMTDGKFITYGITFDVGKATIKPESMGEINRIVQLMTENPDLKFSVEGHTDSTGNPASNQTLSEQRSQAIVAKLVEMGIAQDRLTAVGKGQNNPIADNSTDEGRAKNRRVEFVKM